MQAYAVRRRRLHPVDGGARARGRARRDLDGRRRRPRRGRLRPRSCSRRSALASARSRSRRLPTRPSSSRRRRWATRSRRSRRACSRSPTSWSSTRATGRGRSGRPRSSGRCSSRLAASVSDRPVAPGRRRVPTTRRSDRDPRSPRSSITTASTGGGVPELLAALDRHRARGRAAGDAPARLARAEAQVWAILADRLRADLHEPASRDVTNATMREVAAHRLDPFAAADRLLAQVGSDGSGS